MTVPDDSQRTAIGSATHRTFVFRPSATRPPAGIVAGLSTADASAENSRPLDLASSDNRDAGASFDDRRLTLGSCSLARRTPADRKQHKDDSDDGRMQRERPRATTQHVHADPHVRGQCQRWLNSVGLLSSCS